jgi:hypothetical protein
MPPKLPPEFALLAACCRWPRTAETTDAICRAAAAKIDWNLLWRLVGYHRIAGLVHDGLKCAGVAPPSDVAKKLDAAAMSIARTGLRLAAESVRLQQRFDRADIPILFLKGTALGQRVYASIGLKRSRDIDLFVAQADVEAAVALLEADGYAIVKEFVGIDREQLRYLLNHIRELPLKHAESGLFVEIAWRAANNHRLFLLPAEPPTTQEIALPGRGALRTLADDELLVYLCVHGAGHIWNRLKWLADMHALLAYFAPSELPRLLKLARRRGSGICVGQALLLCERIFGTRLPQELAAELHGSGRLNYLTKAALKKLTAPTQKDLAANRIFCGSPARPYSFLLGRGPAFLREQCRIVLVQGGDVGTFPLPPRLFFLYPALRVPFFLWRLVFANKKRGWHR